MSILHRPTIPESEFRLRLSSLRHALQASGVDGVVLFCRANIAWLTGFLPAILAPNMASYAAFVPMEGEVSIFAMPGQANHIRESAWGEVTNIDTSQSLMRQLAGMAGVTGRVGVELSMGLHRAATASDLARFDRLVGSGRLVDVSEAIWRARMVKTPWEAGVYRRLGEITAEGFKAGLAKVGENVCEADIARAMRERFLALGADAGPTTGQVMVRSGRDRYPVFCGGPTGRKACFGEQVMLAGGPSLLGYHIDIHRFANIGPVEDLELDLWTRSREGLRAIVEATRPGATTGQLFEIAIEAMRLHGAPKNAQWQVFGHGVGLENYEHPMIVEGGTEVLREGVVLALEIPAYDVPDYRVMGAFLEDCVVVTADGCEVLTAGVPLELHVAG